MKRKKWSEQEEETLLNKYSSLLASGTLSKLKTREKKFKPIADHVNSTHHLQDPTTFPFVWSWRDVSIKVQNMRHQYLGVKQKIRLSKDEFCWKDGENHWVNFLMYKDVFGDVEDFRSQQLAMDCEDGLGLGFGADDDDDGIENDLEQDGGFKGFEEVDFVRRKKLKMGFGVGRLGLLGSQILELRDVIVRREEKRRECEFSRENCEFERENAIREVEARKEECQIEREEALERREIELEEKRTEWARKETEKRLRVEREIDKERKKEDEEMEWRERMINLQMEHEKAMIQMQANACQNQMQLVGAMARFMCQFFGSVNDGLVGGLGNSPPQILQNLQLPGGLNDNEKPGDNSPSEFM